MLTGCSGFGLFATPVPHLPELPEQRAFPDLTVEALVEELEADGFTCVDVPDSDITGYVGCTDADDPGLRPRHLIELHIRPHAGPVMDVYASLYGDWDAAHFDELAANAFHDALIGHLFDDDVAPDLAAFTQAVRDNQPKLIEDVWLLVFGKSSNVRTLRVTYHGP